MKKIILWDYQRGSWQYDVFCLLIIVFIFATPKSWFEKAEKNSSQNARLVVEEREILTENVSLEKYVKRVSGNPQAEILGVVQKHDENGQVFYEIDIK